MGLRCSLFGHAFGDPVTERDRETRGAEVLISVRELKRCSRCGTEQVIAENTEVRHLGSSEDANVETVEGGEGEGQTDADVVETPGSDRPQGEAAEATDVDDEPTEDISQFVEKAEEPPVTDAEPSHEPSTESTEEGRDTRAEATPSEATLESEDVELIDESDSEEPVESDDSVVSDAGEEADLGADDSVATDAGEEADLGADDSPGSDPPESDEATAEEDEPVTDDAIIIDNDAGEDDRESDIGRRELAGTGNMFDTSPPEDAGADPTGGGVEGNEPVDADQSRVVDDSEAAGPEGEAETSRDRWPGEDRTDEGDAGDDPGFQFGPDMQSEEAFPEESEETRESPSGITAEGPVDVEGRADDTPPRSVICPECGYETRAIGSSMRAGDICPECHNGYLAERR